MKKFAFIFIFGVLLIVVAINELLPDYKTVNRCVDTLETAVSSLTDDIEETSVEIANEVTSVTPSDTSIVNRSTATNAIASGGHFDDCIQRYNACMDSAREIYNKTNNKNISLSYNIVLGWYYMAYEAIDKKCYAIDPILATTLTEIPINEAQKVYKKLNNFIYIFVNGRTRYGLSFRMDHHFQALEYFYDGVWGNNYTLTKGYACYEPTNNIEFAEGFFVWFDLDNDTWWTPKDKWCIEYRFLYIKMVNGVPKKINVPESWYFETKYAGRQSFTVNEKGEIYTPILVNDGHDTYPRFPNFLQ